MSTSVARMVGQLLAIVVAGLLCSIAVHAQTADSLSDVVARGGETNRIYYYRYADLSTFAVNTNARLWAFAIRDGGDSLPDSDPYPTRIDSLAIRVSIVGDPLSTYTTGSFAWVGLYAADTVPRLITEGFIWDTVLTFSGLARHGIVAKDDSLVDLILYAKFTSPPNIGAQYKFSIKSQDLRSLDTLGKSSGFGRFPVAISDTLGDLNRVVTVPAAIVPNKNVTPVPLPKNPFQIDVVVVDSFYNVIKNSTDTISVAALTPFASLGGTSSRTVSTSEGLFTFDDLSYPYRINYLELVFTAPGLDSLRLPIRVSGGGPDIPTVTTLLKPSTDTTFVIDGLGAKIHFPFGVSKGSFLTELFERVPTPAPLTSGLFGTFVPRYYRVTSDGVLNVQSGYDLGMPTSGLRFIGNPNLLRPAFRTDSLSGWTPAQLIGIDSGRVFGRFDAFGEIGFGGDFDVALPIELVNFTAANDSGGVRIWWRTASEAHNEGFILQRSVRNDSGFAVIASYSHDERLQGLGTSPIGRDYSWVDRSSSLVDGETYYYTLLQEDRDGSHQEYGPIAVEFHPTPLPIPLVAGNIYPNPFKDFASLQLPDEVVGEADVQIVDALGKVVMRSHHHIDASSSRTITIDGSQLLPGPYYWVVRMNERIIRSVSFKLP